MLFNYQAIDAIGNRRDGSIEAVNKDLAISSLQKRGYIVSNIAEAATRTPAQLFKKGKIALFDRVSNKDVVFLSRQIATLFASQVSALRIFRMLASEVENHILGEHLRQIADDTQNGSSISKAFAKHPSVFSVFYVNMVAAGEETGKLDQTFNYLADYLDRNYEVATKARNALIYPSFVVLSFVVVMVLIMTVIIPKLSTIISDFGQAVPFYTKIVIWASNFFVNFGPLILAFLIVLGFLLWRFSRTPSGMLTLSHLKLNIPYVGDLYKKLYLARIADNLDTMLGSAIPIVKSLETTAKVVGSVVYENILNEVIIDVKAGSPVSVAFSRHKEIPGILVQMTKVGEESGELGTILKTLAKFYNREVSNSVDTLIGLIEPAMIILLGAGVGFLLTAVLLPIYNIAGGIT